MNYSRTEARLMDAMAEMDVIDCHEHLPPESVRTNSPQDVFTLFSHYTRCDLFSAGMDRAAYDASGKAKAADEGRKQYSSLFDYDVPLARRWETFRPYWNHIRYGSYARAARLTAKMVYDVDDISDETYQVLSDRISSANTPGIYRRILCDKCRIKASLTQCERTDVAPPLVPLMPIWNIAQIRNLRILETLCDELGVTVKNLDDCLLLVRRQLEKWLGAGAVGFKTISSYNTDPDPRAAGESLKKVLDGQEINCDSRFYEPLQNYLRHHAIEVAGELDMVVAVHAGVWDDFRSLDCKYMLTLAPAHPRVNFDLYHLGMPSVRDAIVVAKNFPNVFLNLCWTHILSQAQTQSGIDELLDQVPINKVLAFGGDYARPVEKVVGHLHMAREDFARVFGARIDRGMMGFDEAVEILRLWFWDNPLALYTKLNLPAYDDSRRPAAGLPAGPQ